MTNGSSERLDRIERPLEQAVRRQEQFEEQISRIQGEMAARQQYHDEAFEWNDAEIKRILEAQAVDGEHIRALVRIAELHHLRLEGIDGGESA